MNGYSISPSKYYARAEESAAMRSVWDWPHGVGSVLALAVGGGYSLLIGRLGAPEAASVGGEFGATGCCTAALGARNKL